MYLSKLFFKTFKEAPADADVTSQKLLERAGYIRKLGKGLYHYTPLMCRVLKKLKTIIREELEKEGAQEITMPMLHPKELWDKTGRWNDFKTANLLYTLKDRENHEYCLGPTHEEAVTSLVTHWLTSYKQLPVNLFQIADKFRDEIRPRFGLMRAKEFIMKDGYAFCHSEASMNDQYAAMRQAYTRIFEKLDLNFAIVRADGGKIGKGRSEEFQVLADIGEDLILTCGPYASNVETTVSIPTEYAYSETKLPLEKISTPHVKTIEELEKFTKVQAHNIVKTIIFKLIYQDRVEFIAIGIRGDLEVNPTKVTNFFAPIELFLASDEEIKKVTKAPTGFAGPINSSIPFVADSSCKPMTNFLTAGNKEEIHYLNVNWERDCPMPSFEDFLLAKEGDRCPLVEGGVYKAMRGIEVGHIFNLGTKYSEAMNATFQDEAGKSLPFWMGCYGIGVGRVAQAVVEQKHDEKGIIWPKALAPYQICIFSANLKDDLLNQKAEWLYRLFLEKNYEVLLDDRNERLGFKLKDSDLMGIPFKLIVGNAFKERGDIEIEPRTQEKFYLHIDQLLSWAKETFP